MCFSATASFVTAGVTGAIGIVAISKINAPRELPLAGAPIVFALQQTIEGLLWLDLPVAPAGTIATGLTFLFLFLQKYFGPYMHRLQFCWSNQAIRAGVSCAFALRQA